MSSDKKDFTSIEECPIKISKNAFNQLNLSIQSHQLPKEYGVRIGIEGNGCSGMNYILGFDKKRPEDVEYTIQGLKIFIEHAQEMYIVGLELDHKATEKETGFIFLNPKGDPTN